MNDWLKKVNDIVIQAASNAYLKNTVGAFDGDAWVWTWRELYPNPRPENIHDDLRAVTRIAQASLRVRFDKFLSGIDIEVSSSAWLVERPNISARHVHFGQHVDLSDLDLDEKAKNLTRLLCESLASAWKDALSIAKKLMTIDEIEKRRPKRIDELRVRVKKDNLDLEIDEMS